MEWKIFVLVAIYLPNALSLPLELCCQSNSIPSSTFNFELTPSAPNSQLGSYLNQQVKILYEEETSCCSNEDLPKPKEKVKRPRTKVPTSIGLRRTKRFPIHLDPLYQYRYLARSGQCPTAKDGQPEFYCPTPDKLGNWRCIDDFQLCDGVRHCPNGEDELPVSCLFYRVVETHLHSVSQRLNSDESRQRNPR